MASVKEAFCIYHVNAPGQEPGAEDLPEGFAYPTMEELSEQVRFPTCFAKAKVTFGLFVALTFFCPPKVRILISEIYCCRPFLASLSSVFVQGYNLTYNTLDIIKNAGYSMAQ